MSESLYGGAASIDATSYGLNPGVQNDRFTQVLTSAEQPERRRNEASRLKGRWGQMDTAAVNWKLHWQRAYEFIVPRKEDVIAVRMAGDDRESDIYDTTAVLANEQLAAALHSMLTNPELRFFELLFGDPELDQIPAVKEWCETCSDRMYQVLNSSNFQTEIHEFYIDLGATGTACFYMEENDDMVVHFSTRALKEIRVDENYLGQVDTVARMFKLKPPQILQQFPELDQQVLSQALQNASDVNSTDQIQILHIVEPVSAVRDPIHKKKLQMKGQKFSSTYMLYDKQFIVRQSGYLEFPYVVSRWTKTSGELYGRGPGFQMLPDIMMLNAMMLTLIQAAQIAVAPPIMVEDDSVVGQVRLTPSGLTVVRAGAERPAPLVTGVRIDLGQNTVEDVRKRIRAGFYVDQLKLPQESPQRTAEEVRQLAEEQMRGMGPVLGRQHFETLKPLITRLFGIMDRRGDFPPVPPQVKTRKFKVRYSSLLARAQRMQEIQNIQRMIATLQPVVQVRPDILDVFKFDDFAKEVADGLGVPARLINDDQKIRSIRAQRQADQQKMKDQADALHQSEVAKNTAPLVQQVGNAKQAGQPQRPGLQPGLGG